MNYITTNELAEKLKVSRQAIWKWRNGGMPFDKLGKLVRFDYEEVKKWLLERGAK